MSILQQPLFQKYTLAMTTIPRIFNKISSLFLSKQYFTNFLYYFEFGTIISHCEYSKRSSPGTLHSRSCVQSIICSLFDKSNFTIATIHSRANTLSPDLFRHI